MNNNFYRFSGSLNILKGFLETYFLKSISTIMQCFETNFHLRYITMNLSFIYSQDNLSFVVKFVSVFFMKFSFIFNTNMFQQCIFYIFTDINNDIFINHFVYSIGFLMHFLCIQSLCNMISRFFLSNFTHSYKLFIISHKISELFLSYVKYQNYTTYFYKFLILFIVLLLRHLFLTNCYHLLTVFHIGNCHHLLTDLPCEIDSSVNSLNIYTFWQHHRYVACGTFVIYKWQFIHGHCLHVQENFYRNVV